MPCGQFCPPQAHGVFANDEARGRDRVFLKIKIKSNTAAFARTASLCTLLIQAIRLSRCIYYIYHRLKGRESERGREELFANK